jgi:hypothetical protein
MVGSFGVSLSSPSALHNKHLNILDIIELIFYD